MTPTTFTFTLRFACARREARMSDAARPAIRRRGTRTRWAFWRSCFERENKRWNRFSPHPQKLEEHISRRLDSDKLIFSPRLNPSQMDALRNATDGRGNPLATVSIPASATSKRPSRRSSVFRSQAQRELCLAARWTARAEGSARRRQTRRRRRPPFAAGNAVSSRSGGNTAQPTNATRTQGFNSYANRIAIAHRQRTHSEFVLCEGFAFRPSNVDGCSHQKYADGSAVTVVNFKSYTQTIPTRSEGCSISSSANSNPSAPMKASDLLIYVLGIAGALAGYFLLQPRVVGGCRHLRRVYAVDALRGGRRGSRFFGSPAFPGRWRISCAAGSSPGAPVRARRNARSTRSPIRFFRTSALGRRLPRSERTLLGDPRKDGGALRARRRPRPAANPAARKR